MEALRGCRSVRGLKIYWTDINSLAALQSLESAERVQITYNKFLKSLEGLEKLSHVGRLEIFGHRRLASLLALQGLQVVTEHLMISFNWKLSSLNGLESLKSAKIVEVRGNEELLSLSGLQNLESAETVTIKDNDILLSYSELQGVLRSVPKLYLEGPLSDFTVLENLTSIGVLSIADVQFESFTGLEGLATVHEQLTIRSTKLISLSGLRGLRSAKRIFLDDNDRLQSLGLGNLTSVDVLQIHGVSWAPSDEIVYWTLAGLEGLTSLDTLEIKTVYGLFSLSGLDNLASVRVLVLDDADHLLSLAGLKSLRSADEVTIRLCLRLLNLTGLEGLTNLSKVSLSSNGILSLAGLEGLTHVSTVQISSNRQLLSLTGFEGLTSVGVLEISNNEDRHCSCNEYYAGFKTLAGLNNLRTAEELRIVGQWRLDNLTGLDSLMSAGVLEIHNNSDDCSGCTWGLRSSAGLNNLAKVTARLSIQHNSLLADTAGFQRLTNAGSLTIHNNKRLVDLNGFGGLERVVGEFEISGELPLHSLSGLEGLKHVAKLSLVNLQSLQSVSALRSLISAWNGVYINHCQQLRSLEGLGSLLTALWLSVQTTGLQYLGGPFDPGASVGAISMDTYSWPSCVTPQEHAALIRVIAMDRDLSTIPNITTWPQWRPHQRPCNRTDFGTFSCTKGHPCNFSLSGKESNYTSVFITDRFTGCGACLENHVKGNVTEDGTVDLGYGLEDKEGGLRSICRCTGEVTHGPVAQLLLRGPRESGLTVCRRGGPCPIQLDGEALERTDRVVLMSDCRQGDLSSGFAADWTAENMYLLNSSTAWGVAPPTRYQVCWRPPCTSGADGPTCPAPENRYFRVGGVELLGTFFRNYTVVLGEVLEAPNIGFGVSEGDRMRLRRACGKANEVGTDLLETRSLGMLFDFGRLTEERAQAGSHQLCWCQQRAGVQCDAEWHFTAVSGDVQVLCPQGQEIVEGGSGLCRECPAGRQSLNPGLQLCTDCPTGQFSIGGDEGCGACQEGTYAERTGSSACAACPAWQSSSVEATGCSADPAKLILLALFYLFVGALCTMLPCTIKRRLLVVDVSLDQKCTVITTFESHGLSNFGSLSFPAEFYGTGHPGLDSHLENFRVRVKDAVRLELLTFRGESIDRRLDTSMGLLAVPFPYDLYHQGWPVPVAFSLPALFSGVATLGALVLWAGMVVVGPLGAAGVALASAAASTAFRWRPRTTPLQQRCAAFKPKLPKESRSCEKGPARAIAIGKLQELLSFFRDFIRDRTAYYLESNVLKQLTSESRLSYAEVAGAGPVEWFVSHFWGTAFEHFCTALHKHAETVCGERHWTQIHYWVCFCSNNQYHIKDELGSGWAESSFYVTLRSGLCRGTCMVLDDKAMPLTRVWCIFELLQTIKLERTGGIFEGLRLCTSSGVLNSGNGSVEVAMALARKVAQMDLGAAQASSEDDAEMIRNQVKTEMGSFAAMNQFIRCEVREMLARAQHSANAQFATVLATLDGNEEELGFATV